MPVYALCRGCGWVFRLNYEPHDPDRWWCPTCAERVRRWLQGGGKDG
jgi:hypothetical protein